MFPRFLTLAQKGIQMKASLRKPSAIRVIAAAVAMTCMGVASAADPADSVGSDSENDFKFGGYVRTWASFNLKDIPDTPENDRGDLSMLRGSLLIDVAKKTGPIDWKAILRLDREYKTKYVERLENLTKVKTPGGPGSDAMNQYNLSEIRELYADIDATERVKLRLGKQQVVWGESDFFHAMDIFHGFDMRWRSFLEGENEELRKPLILANAMIQVPEANGALQVVVRPGWDRDKDIGNTYDLSGGRWDAQTFKGADFLAAGSTMQYDYRHPEGDQRDVTGGVRWKGSAGALNYSLAYLKTFNPDPIVNSAFAPFGKAPSSPFGDWIFPKIDVIGVTASGQVPSIDSVLSTEIVYIKDAPYNVGLGTPGSFFMPQPLGTENTIAGFGGVIKKNAVQMMFRIDKPLNLKSWLGTSADSFFSVQVFDKWILDYKESDEIVDIVGYNAPKRKHSTIVTAILATNFAGNTINPSLAVGYDPQNRGGFVIPSVDFVLGDKWRLKIEADLFFARDERQPSLTSVSGVSENKTHLFGTLANNDQLLFRLTRQF